MPRVPTYDEPQVAYRGQTDARFQAADFSTGGEAIARGLQDTARTADRVGATMDEAAAKQLDVEFSTFERETLYNAESGFYSKQGANALNERAAVETALTAKRTELLGKAKGRARDMLANTLDRRLDGALTGVGRYSQNQAERYADDVSNARIETESGNAVTYRDDPERLEASIHTVRDEVITRETNKGRAPEVVMLLAAKAVSDVHKGVVDAIAADDPAAALRYADVNGSEIDPKDRLAIDKMLKPAIEEQEADTWTDAIRGTGQAVAFTGPVKPDDLIAAVTGQESGGRNGLVSPAGAAGVMQVMPETAKAVCQKLGIPFDANRLRTDPAYCTRIGSEYLRQQLATYGGNTTLALAAYNAGPGAVNKWLKTIGDPRKGEISDAQWAAKIPFKETRDYVPGVIRRLGKAGPRNAPQENDLNAQLAAADAIPDPRIRDKVRSNLMVQDGIDKRLLNDAREKVYDAAWATLDGTGKVPPSIMAALSPTQQRSLRAEQQRLASGETVKTDPMQFVEVQRLAIEEPERFAALNINALRGVFSPGDIRAVGDMQNDIRKNGAKSPKQVTAGRIHSITAPLIEASEMSLVGLKGAKRATVAGQQVAFRQRVAADVEAYVADNKRQPDDQTIQRFADKWLLEVKLPGTGGIISDDKTARLFEVAPGTKVEVNNASVPAAFQTRIVAAYRRQGLTPTRQQIVDAYLSSKVR